LFRRDAGDRQGAFADLQRAADLFQQARDTVNYQKAMYAIQRLMSSPPSQPNYGQPGGEISPDSINQPI